MSFCLGFAMGPIWATVQSIAVDHVPTRSGLIASAMAGLGSLGSVVNQPVFGFIGDHEAFGLHFAVLYAALLLFIFVILLQAARKIL